MSHSEASGSGKAGSSHVPSQTDTATTSATPTGAGSSTETAPNSSNNTSPSEQAWTTVPSWRTPARRGRGGSAGGAYNSPANRVPNTRGRGAWNDGTSGRAPASPKTPGTTAAMSSNSWAKGPPGTIPPKGPHQGSTTRQPTENWRGLNEFVTGKAGAPAPTPAVTTGEPSGEPRTPIALEAPLTAVHNTSATGAANDAVIEKATVGQPTNEETNAATDGRPEIHGVRMNKDSEFPENPHSLRNPLIVSLFYTFQKRFKANRCVLEGLRIFDASHQIQSIWARSHCEREFTSSDHISRQERLSIRCELTNIMPGDITFRVKGRTDILHQNRFLLGAAPRNAASFDPSGSPRL